MKHGLEISKEIKNELKVFFQENKAKIVILSVGENKASQNYISWKQKDCDELGIESNHINFSEDISYEELKNKIIEINSEENEGILLQLPLPEKLQKYKQELIDLISISKDIDGLHSHWIQKRYSDKPNVLYPATPLGIIELLSRNNIDLVGKNVAIIGASHLVGYPLFMLLLNKLASPYLLHSKSNLEHIKNFDILVVATGVKHLIQKKHVNKNMIVIDVGITIENGKLHGDVNPEVKEMVKYLSPVPGGVGPMTRVGIFINLKKLMQMK